MPVKVYSGIAPPKALLDAMAASNMQPAPSKTTAQPSWPADNSDARPPMPPRPARPPVPADAGDVFDDAPPSYEDAMAENLSPVDGPRREYNPPDASVSRGTMEADAKSSAQPGKVREDGAGSAAVGTSHSRESRSSSESFDMLPTTPPESQSGSPPPSPVRRSQSTMKVPRNPVDEENPPQYQPVAGGSLSVSNTMEPSPSRTDLRPMNLGVPMRKPVPRSPGSRGGV